MPLHFFLNSGYTNTEKKYKNASHNYFTLTKATNFFCRSVMTVRNVTPCYIKDTVRKSAIMVLSALK